MKQGEQVFLKVQFKTFKNFTMNAWDVSVSHDQLVKNIKYINLIWHTVYIDGILTYSSKKV